MDGFPPIILIASVSLHERRRVEAMLKATGFTTVGVGDAREAERELEAIDGTALIVIDAGLLEATHDPQWRELRLRRPDLGAIVRRVVPDQKSVQRWDSRTLVVPPGEAEGLRRAVDLLAAATLRPPVPVRPLRAERVPNQGDTPAPLRAAGGCS